MIYSTITFIKSVAFEVISGEPDMTSRESQSHEHTNQNFKLFVFT